DALAPRVAALADAAKVAAKRANADLVATKGRIEIFVMAVIGLSLLVSVLLAWVSGRSIIRPLVALAGARRALAAKNYDHEVPGLERS
ncbi:hypothetical protein ACXYUI_29535, partial [Klebsiella pneumoniae]